MEGSRHRAKTQEGFTLIELMIVVVIIGILAATAIPNFVNMENRAKEAGVRSNMHAIQVAVEDFAVQTCGYYPDDATSTTPSGQTVADLCPGAAYPDNPFTDAATVVSWDADPMASGEIAINPANTDHYMIKGFGKDALLGFTLIEGM